MSVNVQSCRRGSPQRAVIVVVSEANEAGNWLLSDARPVALPFRSTGAEMSTPNDFAFLLRTHDAYPGSRGASRVIRDRQAGRASSKR